jgi:hypothetical protein
LISTGLYSFSMSCDGGKTLRLIQTIESQSIKNG